MGALVKSLVTKKLKIKLNFYTKIEAVEFLSLGYDV